MKRTGQVRRMGFVDNLTQTRRGIPVQQSPQGIHHYIFGLCSHSNSPIRHQRVICTVRDIRFSAVSRMGLFGQFQIPILKRFGKMSQRLPDSSVFPFLLRSFHSRRLLLNFNSYRFFFCLIMPQEC
jgi:hypothetical protein